MKTEQKKAGKARVFLVDDHPIVREHLAQLINQQDDLLVCGESSAADECLRLLPKMQADLAIVDLSLQNSHGIDLIKDLHLRFPELPVLVLSMHDELTYVERSLRAGARGYVTKAEATTVVMTAIRRVLGGEIYLNERMATQLVGLFIHGYQPADGPALTARLTDRELQLLELIGRGHPTRKIAEILKIDVKTVDTHRSHLREKLKVANVEELRVVAERWVQSAHRIPQ
ncbi:MAG: Transcriptional activator protein ExaE [Verrucomicrobiae bacterium]|nr:Transcriptional activator protein ExaE [Verrucomicrobiae bacterium]